MCSFINICTKVQIICLGFKSSVKLISVNTFYMGQCYLIKANKHEFSPSFGTTTALMMNLLKNDSVALLFIIPSARKSEKAAVIDEWNYPVKQYELCNDNFLKLVFNREVLVRKSTEGSPCTDREAETYYQVHLYHITIVNIVIQALKHSCLVHC